MKAIKLEKAWYFNEEAMMSRYPAWKRVKMQTIIARTVLINGFVQPCILDIRKLWPEKLWILSSHTVSWWQSLIGIQALPKSQHCVLYITSQYLSWPVTSTRCPLDSFGTQNKVWIIRPPQLDEKYPLRAPTWHSLFSQVFLVINQFTQGSHFRKR